MLNPDIGHNNPPSDAELLIERLAAESHADTQRAVDLAKSSGRVAIVDAESAGRATLLVSLIMTAKDTIEARQKAAKKPHAELATAAYDYFKHTLELLASAKLKTLEALTAWNAEQHRIAAAVAAESGQIVTAPEIRSPFGQKAVERKTWTYSLAKLDDVPRSFLKLDEDKIKAHIKARPQGAAPVDVPGLHFYESTSISVKR